ncbi:MAG: hypothetical protein HYZ28_06435 [Myxococcales bacterium]|nr:hypothetical protein [Myxococcales bacterium]
MPARAPPPDEVSTLIRQNRELNEQVKQLVRAERQLYLSRREVERQLGRTHALNRFALEAGGASEPGEILRALSEMLAGLFPFEQGLGLLVQGGRLVPAAVFALPGREGKGEEELSGRAIALDRAFADELPSPRVLSEPAARKELPRSGPLLDLLSHFFCERAGCPVQPGVVLWLPLWRKPGELAGLLLMRKAKEETTFHCELPADRDSFLEVAARHAAAAVSNALLLDDLKRSYGTLERTQAELVAKERLAAVGELAAVMAHEVRNPLGVVFNSLGSLRKLLGDVRDGAALLDMMEEEADRLDRIVGDLLDFARPKPPNLLPEALEPIIFGAIETARRAVPNRGVDFQVEVRGLGAVVMDSRMIRQALVNLLINAVQALPRGGRVRVLASEEARGGEPFARIEVSDDGPGIPSESAMRLFEPFFTTKASGTGLGLAVVRRFVEAHQGEVAVETSPERGTTFRVLIPVGRG